LQLCNENIRLRVILVALVAKANQNAFYGVLRAFGVDGVGRFGFRDNAHLEAAHAAPRHLPGSSTYRATLWRLPWALVSRVQPLSMLKPNCQRNSCTRAAGIITSNRSRSSMVVNPAGDSRRASITHCRWAARELPCEPVRLWLLPLGVAVFVFMAFPLMQHAGRCHGLQCDQRSTGLPH